MTFANPAAWWLTTLMVPIIALHVLKAQRTEVVVSSTLGWESVDRPVAAARPWQRLRWSIPLLLQLLVVALLAAALAGPAWDTGRISAQHVVVMVDTSASMDGTDGSPTRLAAAKDAVRDLLDDLGTGTRVSIIATGSPAHIVASEVPVADVDDRLDQLETSEGGFDAEATGSLAVSLDRPDRSVENVLVSDGGLDASAIRLLPAGTRFVSVGRSDRNVGVTNVVVTARGNLLHVQATVFNSGAREVTAVVRVDVDGRTRDTASVKVPDHSSVETASDVAPGSRVEVLLDGEDVLRLDDHVYAAGPELTKVKVLVVGDADPFLDALVASNPDIEPTTMTAVEFAAAATPFDGMDMAIFDEAAVPDTVPVPYLAIAPPGGTSEVTVDGDVTEPVPTLVRDDVDLLADLDLKGLAIATAQKVSAPAASSLIAAEDAPLLVSGRDGNSPFVYLAMPIAQSNLGLLPAFPVLGDRLFDSLGRTDLVSGDLHAGDALALDAAAEAVVTSPTGTETTVRPGTSAPELDRTGFWKVAIAGQGERTVVVNPDPAESDVAPVEELAIPGVRGGLDGDGEPVTRSIVAWLVIAALVALVAEWLLSRRRRGVTKRQWRWAEYLRVAVALLLLVALWAPSFQRSTGDVATVFVVDLSDSMSASRSEVLGVLEDALADQPAGSVAGVVLVGAQARVDAAVEADLSWTAPRTVIDGSATDLAAGLRVAGALAPPDHARRVVLVSDGRATAGSGLSTETARLQRAGIRLDVIPVEPAFGADVSVTSVDAPSRARPGDDIPVTVNLTATAAQKATVTLFRDGVEVEQRLVDVPVGTSVVEFTQPAGDSGAISWSARVSGPSNGVVENDESRASTRIEGRPTVLLVEGVPGGSATLAAALDAAGVVTTVTEPERLGTLAELAGVDAVVLVNVAAARLSVAQTDDLSHAVRELGTGLLAIGGTSSYGAGDYLGSALEELLPVTSEAKDPKKRSKVAEVFAVDVSGSMGACHCADGSEGSNSRLGGGVTKTDIARDSAIRSLEGFHPDDEIGVVALDESQTWIRDLAPVGDGADARDKMDDIEHGEGMTNLDPSLTVSAARLRDSDASTRHIVLFTDGFTDTAKLEKLADQAADLRDEGITVSVMGTGEGASEELRGIADAGGGRYYAGRDLKELPDLLLEETKVVARQLIVEGEFLPEISSAAPVVAGLTSAPPLEGYVATTPKPTATQHLRIGDEHDPLLATWRVGLGQVASWTSDSGERWGRNWAAWDGSVSFWSDVVRSILPTPAGAAQLRFNGAEATIDATFDEPVADGAEVTAQVVDPSGVSRNVRLQRVDDNNFSGTAEVGGAGTYGVGVTASVNGETEAAISTTAELGFSREYLAQAADTDLMRELSRQTDGRGVIRARQAFDADGLSAGRYRIDLRVWLLLAALALWPITIAVSRLRRQGSALAVESLRKGTKLGDLAHTIGARRDRTPKPAPTSAPKTQTQTVSRPSSPPVSPPASAPTAPPASPPTPPASSIDSLLAAKRKRERRD